MTIAIRISGAGLGARTSQSWNAGYLVFALGILLAAANFAMQLSAPAPPRCETTAMGDIAACFE